MSKECPIEMYAKELNDPQFDRDVAVESALVHLRNNKHLLAWIKFRPHLSTGCSALARALVARINWVNDTDYIPSGINMQRAVARMGYEERSALCDALQEMVRNECDRKDKECR